MKQKMFTVLDTKAMAYLPPFFLPNEAVAKRVFGDMATDQTHQFGKHPEDFSMYYLGEFEDMTSVVEIDKKAPVLIATGLMIKAERDKFELEFEEARA